MGADSKIQWTHHTFNPWRGCAKVSPGCAHCYAETLSKRNPAVLGTWGKDGTRAIGSDAYWRQPLAWNRAAEKAGERRRVFCASLADVCEERADLVEPRRRLMMLIVSTPNLDWLLLTKRPENIAGLFDWSVLGCFDADEALPNVWWGTTVENQEQADKRIPHLLRASAVLRFLSVEPLLGPVDLTRVGAGHLPIDARNGGWGVPRNDGRPLDGHRGIDWVIVGGESGPGARPCDVAWIRDVVHQCREAGTACFVKQLGANVLGANCDFPSPARGWWGVMGTTTPYEQNGPNLSDPKGGDPAEWPLDLRVREFPEVQS